MFRDGVLSVPGYTFEKVCLVWYPYPRHLIITEGIPMGRHWEHDIFGGREQPERRIECTGQNSSRSVQRIHVSRKGGSHVSLWLSQLGGISLSPLFHSLGRLSSSSDAHRTTLRFIDFFNIPRVNGDCVVLLLLHPGLNLLGRYLPPSKINSLLLADLPKVFHPSHGDVHLSGIDELDMLEQIEVFDIMDLASFLE